MQRIKIAQIGICHEHAGGKMYSLRLLPEVFEIVGVVDDSNTTAARFGGFALNPDERKAYEGLSWMSEDELLNYPGLQAVVVETPNAELVPTALRCMSHNLPIHMDKPGGEDMAQFRQLREGYERRNLPFQMGYMFRGNPAMQWCLRAVHSGWLGEIFEVQAGMSHDYGGEEYQHYLSNFKGGIMFNLGCHLIDFVVSLLGRPQDVSSFLKSAPGYADNIKNNCLSVLEYPHATVTLRACSKEVNGLGKRCLKVCGSKGSIELSPLEMFNGKPLLMQFTLKEDIPDYPAGTHTINFGVRRDRYEEELFAFAKMVRGEMENPFACAHDCLVQEVVLAASGYTKWER